MKFGTRENHARRPGVLLGALDRARSRYIRADSLMARMARAATDSKDPDRGALTAPMMDVKCQLTRNVTVRIDIP
jgi:hypothetical protein